MIHHSGNSYCATWDLVCSSLCNESTRCSKSTREIRILLTLYQHDTVMYSTETVCVRVHTTESETNNQTKWPSRSSQILREMHISAMPRIDSWNENRLILDDWTNFVILFQVTDHVSNVYLQFIACARGWVTDIFC